MHTHRSAVAQHKPHLVFWTCMIVAVLLICVRLVKEVRGADDQVQISQVAR